MLVGFEVPAHAAEHDNRQHDGAQGHVHAVESGQHEKGGPVNSGTEGQPQVLVSLLVFSHLEIKEYETQRYRQAQPAYQELALIGLQCMMCEGQRDAR